MPFSIQTESKPVSKFKQYHKYLLSKKWKLFRQRALDFYGHNCGRCGSKFNIEIHHKTYRNIFNETLSDVIPLCDKCHNHAHKLKRRNKSVGKVSKFRNAYYNKSAVTYFPDRKRT